MIAIEIRIVSQTSRLILETEKYAGQAGRADGELQTSDGLHLSLGNGRLLFFLWSLPNKSAGWHGLNPSGALEPGTPDRNGLDGKGPR